LKARRRERPEPRRRLGGLLAAGLRREHRRIERNEEEGESKRSRLNRELGTIKGRDHEDEHSVGGTFQRLEEENQRGLLG